MNINDLINIILSDKPSDTIKSNEEELFKMIPELKVCKGFNQNNEWHIYDVYEHILHVIDEVPSTLELRLAALFHDVGKPSVYFEDDNKVGHFYNHWTKSKDIFLEFAAKYKLDKNITDVVAKLIYYHDIGINMLDTKDVEKIVQDITKEELKNDLNHYKEYLELRKKIEDEYIESYFETRLKDLDVLKLIEIFKNKFGKDIILLCHEPIEEFCHRRLVADYIELKTGIYIPEIKQENNKIKELKPIRYKDRLEKYL